MLGGFHAFDWSSGSNRWLGLRLRQELFGPGSRTVARAGSTPALTAITLDATPSDFEFLWDWEDRGCNVIEHARGLPPW